MAEAYRLSVVRLTGHQLESPDVGTWLADWGFRMRSYPEVQAVDFFNISNPRIAMCRNAAVEHAKGFGSTHILWLDPDMGLDRYVQRNAQDEVISRAKPFWHEAWEFIKRHPFSVAAAPYAGRHPHRPIHVFVKNDNNQLIRVRHEDAPNLSGWSQVAGVGTGAMLMDIRIFDRLEFPYFKDTFIDRKETKLRHSQDVHFCATCEQAQIPVYVNWDCPCGHWQLSVVEMPGWDASDAPEQPLPPCAADPSVPLLRIRGQGDTSWSG